MNITDTIENRTSIRTFLMERITQSEKIALEQSFSDNQHGLFGEKFHFQLIEKDNSKEMKLDYGMISNHRNYLLAYAKNTMLERMSYGYALEKIVLKATELDLGTCWVGYFDAEYFSEIDVPEGYTIPSIVIVGKATEKPSLRAKFIEFTISASKRKSWADLFFNSNFNNCLPRSEVGLYENPLEMVRSAPSSGNTQPWRILKEQDQNIFHFYKKPVSKKYEAKGLHDIDLGIGLAHFELTAHQFQLPGNWKRLDNLYVTVENDLIYMISWIGV